MEEWMKMAYSIHIKYSPFKFSKILDDKFPTRRKGWTWYGTSKDKEIIKRYIIRQ